MSTENLSDGLQFDLRSLASAESLARLPLFVVALLAVRGLPAFLYVRVLGRRQTLAAALLQATSLPFIVASTQIGLALGVVQRSTAAALVAAGLASVVVFPLLALVVSPSPAGATETEPGSLPVT